MNWRRWFKTAAWSMMAALVFACPAHAAGETVTVFQGESTLVNLGYKFKELAIGNPTVADYMVRKNTREGAEILINGKQTGVTNLIVWDASGKKRDELSIVVKVRDLNALLTQIKSTMGQTPGVRYRIAGGKIVVEGEALLHTDLAKLKKVVGSSPQVVNLVTISPVALNVIAKKIQSEVGSSAVKVRVVGQQIALTGEVFGKEEADRLVTLSRLYYPQVVNLIKVKKADLDPGAGDMIQVTAQFIEVNSAVIDGWGASWSPMGTSSLSAQQTLGSGSSFGGALVGTISGLLPKMSRAKEQGGARVLETSSVSVRSGERANFHSGGEMGIPTPTQGGGTTMTFKQYGVFLKVLPIAQGDKVSLKINVEISSPTGTSPGGFINFTKTTMDTVQYCNSGDSIALGGLISQRDTKTFDALPDGSTGAIVQLYASEDFRKKKSQLVVLVTPTILAAGAKDAHQELKGQVEEKWDSYEERKR